MDEQSIPDWENTSVKLCNIIIDKEKFIEDCENMIQVDFANSYIGDGVLTLVCIYIYIYIYILFNCTFFIQ